MPSQRMMLATMGSAGSLRHVPNPSQLGLSPLQHGRAAEREVGADVLVEEVAEVVLLRPGRVGDLDSLDVGGDEKLDLHRRVSDELVGHRGTDDQERRHVVEA
jgi:hypothetical protein